MGTKMTVDYHTKGASQPEQDGAGHGEGSATGGGSSRSR